MCVLNSKSKTGYVYMAFYSLIKIEHLIAFIVSLFDEEKKGAILKV